MPGQPAPSNEWILDSDATSHMTSDPGNLTSFFPSFSSSMVTVGNGSSSPVIHIGLTTLPTLSTPLKLNNVLIVSNLVRNLVSVRKLVADNSCSIEFDLFGFCFKDLRTMQEILHCNSNGDLYPIIIGPSSTSSSTSTHHPHALLVASTSTEIWHCHLGHPGHDTLSSLTRSFHIPCNKVVFPLCHACQWGKHVRLPFSCYNTTTVTPFQIIHCDLWTSLVLSNPGYQYYLAVLDDFSHYLWTFPLRRKSKVFSILYSF